MFIDTAPHALFIRIEGVQRASPENACAPMPHSLGVSDNLSLGAGFDCMLIRVHYNSVRFVVPGPTAVWNGLFSSTSFESHSLDANLTFSISIATIIRFQLRQRVHLIVVVVQLKLICKFVQLST